jgi:thiopurine S-methyltransferase
MDPQFWLDKWAKQELGFHLDAAHPLLQRHWPSLWVPKGSTVFVPLCGKSLDLIYLRRMGYRVVGSELSPLAVEQFYAEHGLEPQVAERDGMQVWEAADITLIQGDFFDLDRSLLPDIAAVYDRAALVALPPERQPMYARRIMALAPESAPILLITLEYAQPDMPGPPFSTPAAQVERCFGARYPLERLEARDALQDNPGLRARGLAALTEVAWRLRAAGPDR